MNPTIMSATREAALSKIGQGIEFDHTRQKLILTGRKTGQRIPPLRERVVRIRNVRAAVKGGFLVSPELVAPSFFSEITYFQHNDEVLTMERGR